MASCPECDAALDIDDEVEEGAKLDCPECGAELEAISTNPLEFKVVLDEEEEEQDW